MDLHIHIAHLHLNLPDGSPVLDLLTKLVKQGETIMDKLDAIDAALDEVESAVTAETEQVTAELKGLKDNVASLETEVTDLKNQVAAGNAITDERVAALVARVKKVKDGVAAIDPNVPAAPPVDNPPVDPPAVP